MNITKDVVAQVPLDILVKDSVCGFSIDAPEFYGAPGAQHYRLLAHLSRSLSPGQTIIDIGTHRGSSALALSTNPDVTIYSFDIQRKISLRDLPNVNFELADLWDETVQEHWAPTVLNSAIILLDIDPHHGVMEYEFYLWLKEKGYKGLLVCDDIWYFKPMRDNFWYKIPTSEKLDITALGHWSGTGVISFVPRPDITWETYAGLKTIGAPPVDSPWTVVTAYFDLTKMPDASPAIKQRSQPYYMENARATLGLDQNLVVFCEEENLEQLKALRPSHLLEKTRFYTVNFENLPMTKYRDTIRMNRIKFPYRGDERNTPSYYLLCMARYGLLKRVMDENPFKSSHFSWLNICIERMGYNNLVHLDDIFDLPARDKVSTTFIDYISKNSLTPVKNYYEFGRCSLCSGFFTGAKSYLYDFCNRIEEKFLYYLSLGYGHADEQLYSPVYFDAPELFEPYYGDYQQMITNYRGFYENPQLTLRTVLPKSFDAKDWDTCLHVCECLWRSLQEKKVFLTKEETHNILTKYSTAAFESGRIQTMKNSGALKAFYSL